MVFVTVEKIQDRVDRLVQVSNGGKFVSVLENADVNVFRGGI